MTVARLAIRRSTYRGEYGWLVSGTDARGRHPKVFVTGPRSNAEQVKRNLLADTSTNRNVFEGCDQSE